MPTSSAPAEHLWFDSDVYAAGEAFDRYRELYSAGADAVRIGPAFKARVRAWRLDRVLMFDRYVNDMGHERDAERVERDGFDHFTVTLVRAGRFEIDTGAGFTTIPVGRAVLVDMLAPMRNRMTDAHIVTISMARDRVLAATGAAAGLHGHQVGLNEAALLFDYVGSLLKRIETLPGESLASATIALGALLAIALGGVEVMAGQKDGARRDAIRIGRVRAIVDAGLSDPNFGADATIAQSGLSRATLYRVFRAQGGLAGYIQGRRLERVRMALTDGADTRSFADIAFASGFVSESHCSRLFRDRFGLRPGEYRATLQLPAEENDPRRQMRIWQDEVR